MLGTKTVKNGSWTLLLLRLPGEAPIPVGVLLLDFSEDKLYIRMKREPASLDDDVALVWSELEEDLNQKAIEMGGSNLIRWLEEEASHTLVLGNREEIQINKPDDALAELFRTQIERIPTASRKMFVVNSQKAFTPAEIAEARETLPISKSVGIEALKICQNPRSSYQDIERVLVRDPGLTAHLIRLGNLAAYSRGGEARTVSEALMRIGMDQTKLHIWAMSMKGLYSSPALERIWNHSLFTVDVVTHFCEEIDFADSSDAKLLALLHDIGQLVLNALGASYRDLSTELLAKGWYPVEIERRLCGVTHADIGADLLASWQFAPDLSEAVRYHHSFNKSMSRITSLLYCSECWTDVGEDIYDPDEHANARAFLGLTRRVRNLPKTTQRADLAMLRFAG